MDAERARFNKRLDQVEALKAESKSKLIYIFSDVSMRKGHPGMAEMAAKAKIDVGNLNIGEYVLFINKQKTALKLFAANNNLNYFKMPDRAGRLDMRIISLIPKYFNGKKLDYDKAIKEVLEKELSKK